DTLSWLNEDELDESNELNDLNTSNISENVHDLDAESGSSSPDQPLSHNSGITVTVANSLGKRVRKKRTFTHSRRPNPRESWVWTYFRKNKVEKKIYCKVIVEDKDGLEKECDNDYELSTGTGNLKSHLRQIHRILPPEKNNNQN
ncbi:6349_t:CDS:1, partial [Dentiscutata erythropus]